MVESFKTGAEFYKVVGPDKMVAMRQVDGQGAWGGSFNAGIQTQYQELRESVYRDKMTGEDAAAELQKRTDTEWKNQGLS